MIEIRHISSRQLEVSTTTGEPVTPGSFNDSDRSVSREVSVEDLWTIQTYHPAIPTCPPESDALRRGTGKVTQRATSPPGYQFQSDSSDLPTGYGFEVACAVLYLMKAAIRFESSRTIASFARRVHTGSGSRLVSSRATVIRSTAAPAL